MKLLLVDDEPEILKMLTRHLALEGYEVVSTASPREAVELMREHLFNLVITDIRMPELSGVELLGELRRINPLANVLIITGYSNMSYVVDCLAAGAVDYFTKPITDMELFLRIVSDAQQRVERWLSAMTLGERYGKASAG